MGGPVKTMVPSDGRGGPGLLAGQTSDAAGDAGAALDIGDVGKADEALLEQREVGAGEDDGVDAVASVCVEHRSAAARDRIDVHLLAGELRFGKFDQLGRAMADNGAIGSEPGGEIVDIRLPDGRFGAETPMTRVSDISAAGLIAGTVPTTGRSSAEADVVECDRARRVAGDHREPRRIARPTARGAPAHGWRSPPRCVCRKESRRCRRRRRSAHWAAAPASARAPTVRPPRNRRTGGARRGPPPSVTRTRSRKLRVAFRFATKPS